MQGFVGIMDYVRARKGAIMTTSAPTKYSGDFVGRIEGKKVVLIDGDQPAALMIEHGLGVVTTKTYESREVSNDFFDERERGPIGKVTPKRMCVTHPARSTDF